jgi:hypothetical protein
MFTHAHVMLSGFLGLGKRCLHFCTGTCYPPEDRRWATSPLLRPENRDKKALWSRIEPELSESEFHVCENNLRSDTSWPDSGRTHHAQLIPGKSMSAVSVRPISCTSLGTWVHLVTWGAYNGYHGSAGGVRSCTGKRHHGCTGSCARHSDGTRGGS